MTAAQQQQGEQHDLTPVDGGEMRRVLGHFATGVTVVTAAGVNGPVGMVVNSFTSVSLEPPLVLFCAAHSSETWPEIRAAGRFCVNVLGHHQEELAMRFAKKGTDRYQGVEHILSGLGTPRLTGAIAQIDCEIAAEYEAGDHMIVVGRVVAMEVEESEAAELRSPLIFYRGGFSRL